MPGEWDRFMKQLLNEHKQHFASWLIPHSRIVEQLSLELAGRTIFADSPIEGIGRAYRQSSLGLHRGASTV